MLILVLQYKQYCLNIILLSLQMLSYYSKLKFYLLKENELGRVLDTYLQQLLILFFAQEVCVLVIYFALFLEGYLVAVRELLLRSV